MIGTRVVRSVNGGSVSRNAASAEHDAGTGDRAHVQAANDRVQEPIDHDGAGSSDGGGRRKWRCCRSRQM